MDVEREKVIELVFPDGISTDYWKDNGDYYQYLSKLGGFDLDQLCKEADHLIEEKKSVQETTRELASSNYKTFIGTAESSREIFHQFSQTQLHLDNLLEKIPEFVEKCQFFCDKSKSITTHKHLNNLTLKKNVEMLEILEMPQLMESCLQSGQFNEALELSQYARQLGMKHNDIPLVQSIVSSIENSWSGMVGQVIGSLRGDLPLPKCLQLVGLLRSMDAFSEAELRIKFLQARDCWLQGLLNAIPKDDPNYHLNKTLELSRIHLFNIITQYRAMFSDDDNLTSGRDKTINEFAIFYHWLEEKLSQFLTTLEQDLVGVSSIDSILGQCTYFSLSLGRVGADFTSRMSDIFIRVIGNKFHKNICKATRRFEKDMESFTLINKTHRTETKIESPVKSEHPPEQLIDFYPLAEYCNGLIGAFNELRVCPPVALAGYCTHILEESLQCVAKGILIFYKQEQQAFTASERENMLKLAECFSDFLIPYVQYCIHAIFPQNQIAVHLDITVGQLQKEGITSLDSKKIIEPITTLLPVKRILNESFLSSVPSAESTPHPTPVTSTMMRDSVENVEAVGVSTPEAELPRLSENDHDLIEKISNVDDKVSI